MRGRAIYHGWTVSFHMTHKPRFLLWVVAAAVIYLALSHHDNTSAESNSEDNECAKRIEEYTDSLVPSSKWIEMQSWIISIAGLFNIKMPDMENNVANYEVARFHATQLALSQAKDWPLCKDDQSDK
jgi:hypothetical protein